MVLRIYGVPFSQPTRAVIWLLKMKSQPFEFVPVKVASKEAGGSRSPDFLSKFLTGVVPTMEDTEVTNTSGSISSRDYHDGSQKSFHLAESNAIMSYLCSKYKWNDLYPNHNLQERARVDEVLHWHHTNTRSVTVSILPTINPALGSRLPLEYIQVHDKVAKRSMQTLGKMLERSGGDYLCGDNVTIADLCVYGDVGQLSPRYGLCEATGFDASIPKNVLRWMDTMETKIPGYDDSHEILRKVTEKIKSKL